VQFPGTAIGTAASDQKVPGSFPADCSFSSAAQDLLQRLLEPNPRSRLRSLLALQGIAFFKDFSFADARAKKVWSEVPGLSTSILILFPRFLSFSI
jgi:serine/threonine protein kinase